MINFSELLWKSSRPGDASRPRDAGLKTDVIDRSEDIQSLPTFRHVPVENLHSTPDSRIGLLTDPRGATADRFRFLRMRLREFRELAKLRSLVITSPTPEDGKSTVAVSLATILAEGGNQSILLIEADLHHPSIRGTLNLAPRAGLAECLEDGAEPLELVRKIEPFGWYLLSAGEARGNPTELLQSDRLPAVMKCVTSHFDWIIVDTPPTLPLMDALLLSRQVDAVLLVARAGRTKREAIEETVKLIGEKHLVGIVLNGAEGLSRLYSQYRGRYGKK